MLQDKIAFGSIEAHRAQLTLIKHVSDQFLQASWRSGKICVTRIRRSSFC